MGGGSKFKFNPLLVYLYANTQQSGINLSVEISTTRLNIEILVNSYSSVKARDHTQKSTLVLVDMNKLIHIFMTRI